MQQKYFLSGWRISLWKSGKSKEKRNVKYLYLRDIKYLVFCRAAFSHNYHCLTQDTVIDHIAGLQLGNDGSRRFVRVFHFLNDLMVIRVKTVLRISIL